MSDLKKVRRTFRPRGVRVLAYVSTVLMTGICSWLAFGLPEYARFNLAENITLFLWLGAIVVVLHGVGRSAVTIGDQAIRIRNGYRTHEYAYRDVAGVSFRDGAPWPTLVTKDDDRVMLFGIQRSDGGAAEAVATLRERLA